MISDAGRILVWFSCGAASAVAAKVAVERYGREREVEVCYCAGTANDEHPDNQRFRLDVEKWIGRPVKMLHHHKYNSIDDVFIDQRFMTGPHGAVCSKILKRQVREKYQRPSDFHVFGFTSNEAKRITEFEMFHPDLKCLWLLAPAISKDDCYRILTAAGIELPAMYRMGYRNANCIGCVRGGKGYWNKIRRDFPEVFQRRALIQRDVGCRFGSGDVDRGFFLDELDPEAGRDVKEPNIECGMFCDSYTSLVQLAVLDV